jgi:asparagine synthase (glutamine-hydrolysing)
MQATRRAFGGIPTLAYAKIFEQARKMRYWYYWTVEYGRNGRVMIITQENDATIQGVMDSPFKEYAFRSFFG